MIRIGLLGASRIAPGAIIRPADSIDNVAVTRVAARDSGRARAYADEHHIDGVETDYRALVESDAVDLVYNGLPPAGHAEWSIAAMRAGKDVLCEKPFTLNAAEAQTVVDAAEATGRTLIEAYHYRFHPAFLRLLDVIRSGEIGEIKHIDARFCYPIPYARGELRYDAALGGGALMDLGCYPLHWIRTTIGEEPEVRSAVTRMHERGVDVETTATLAFDSGVVADMRCSMDTALPERLDAPLVVTGDRGRVTLSNALAPHNGHRLIIESGGTIAESEVEGQTTYRHQLEHVVGVLGGDTAPLTGGRDAVAQMELIDEVRRAAGIAIPG